MLPGSNSRSLCDALVALCVAAPVPNELKQDSNYGEQEHSNDQTCHRWGDFFAGSKRLRDGTKGALVERNVRQPVAHAGRPRDVAVVASRTHLPVSLIVYTEVRITEVRTTEVRITEVRITEVRTSL